MNPANGRTARPGFFGTNWIAELKGPGARQGRRQFRPMVTGLEGRQLLASSALSTLASFNGTQQSIVGGLVADGQGNLYGTTSAGGDAQGKGDGTVFEIAKGSKTATTLASFDGSEGYGIGGVALDGQGNLFGTTQEGGASGDGTVFEIAKGSKTVTTVASFNGTDGKFPNGVVVDGQGNLYGTTAYGWAGGGATAFEIARGSNTITTVATFNNAGSAPSGVVVDGQGNLYGLDKGGANGAGTVFEIARGSGTVTTLASFNGLIGSDISGVVVDGQGNLYGTTQDGGAYGYGSVFEVARGSNTVTTLASFNNTTLTLTNFNNINGSVLDPGVGVVVDGQGNLFGTTQEGGAHGYGTVFEIAHGSDTVTTLASFNNPNGAVVNGVILDGQGNLYGTTVGGGNGGGTVFKLTLDHQSTSPAITPTNPTIAVQPISIDVSKKTIKAVTDPTTVARSRSIASPLSVARDHRNIINKKVGTDNSV
jgi:uncharacterized repeat protein (TIGR03803 family)